MKLYNTPDNRRIEMTKDEYLTICEEHNLLNPDPRYQYDIIEIECTDIDILTVTEDMLDESEYGFFMFSTTFYYLMQRYTDFPLIHDEDVVEVMI